MIMNYRKLDCRKEECPKWQSYENQSVDFPFRSLDVDFYMVIIPYQPSENSMLITKNHVW